jgi:hypothetical protein
MPTAAEAADVWRRIRAAYAYKTLEITGEGGIIICRSRS